MSEEIFIAEKDFFLFFLVVIIKIRSILHYVVWRSGNGYFFYLFYFFAEFDVYFLRVREFVLFDFNGRIRSDLQCAVLILMLCVDLDTIIA